MSQIKTKRFFYVTSGSQLTGLNSTFQVSLQIPDNANFDRISLIQANIPISYYMVQTGFNTFTLRENSTSVTITVPAGNYNANSFSTILPTLLNTASPNSLTYTITYPINYTENNTGLFTYTVNSSTVAVSLIMASNNDLCEQLGFNVGSTNTFTAVSGTSTLASANVIKFISEDTIFIHSNIVDNEYNDVLQEIYFSNNTIFSNQSWLNPDPLALSKKLSTNKSQGVSFSITNENGTPIYLNGLSVNFTIMLYKDNDFYRKSEQFMKYQVSKQINQ